MALRNTLLCLHIHSFTTSEDDDDDDDDTVHIRINNTKGSTRNYPQSAFERTFQTQPDTA